jgi:hypothetical protein
MNAIELNVIWLIIMAPWHCGLYYKHTAIINYASSIVNKLEALLTDDARVVSYDHHVFIVQATGVLYVSSLLYHHAVPNLKTL